jgi:predicted dehydrogenase
MTTNLAFIGYGAIAKSHAMGYRDIPFHYGLRSDAINIIGVATRHRASSQAAADELGCAIATDDYRSILMNPEVDVVDICTAHDSHEEIAVAAAEAGKHIYLEKPVARNVAEARRIADAIKHNNVKCGLTFNFRYFPCVTRAKQLIDDGFVGRIFHFHARYFRSSYIDPMRPMSWRLRKAQAGGGVLIDSGAHAVDLVQWLIGDVASVRAVLDTPHTERPKSKSDIEKEIVDVEDTAFLQIRLSSSVIGTLEASRMATGATNDVWFEVRGDKGALRFTLEEPNWLYVYDTHAGDKTRGFVRVETVSRYEGALAPDWSQPVGVNRTHAECQYRFLRAIWDDTPTSPNIDDGLRVQEIVEAAYVSAERDEWVQVRR